MSHDQFFVLLGLLFMILATQQIHGERDREPTALGVLVMVSALWVDVAGAVLFITGLLRWLA